MESPGVSERCKQELVSMLHLGLQGGPTPTGLAGGGEAKEETMAMVHEAGDGLAGGDAADVGEAKAVVGEGEEGMETGE